MMATTHVLVGLVLAMPVALAAPDLADPILLGAAIGSVLPDLDVIAGHRRTLHYPRLGPIVAFPAIVAAVVWPTPLVVGTAATIAGAALHARTDVYGGGLELRPWQYNSEKAVYDHVADEWLPPRRLIRYDGAPEDVALAGVLAVPVLVVVEGPLWWAVAGAIVISLVYGVFRKSVVEVALKLLAALPRPIAALIDLGAPEEDVSEQW